MFEEWLRWRQEHYRNVYKVRRTRLDRIPPWHFDAKTGAYGRDDGEYFKIVGVVAQNTQNGFGFGSPMLHNNDAGKVGLTFCPRTSRYLVRFRPAPGNVGLAGFGTLVPAVTFSASHLKGVAGRVPERAGLVKHGRSRRMNTAPKDGGRYFDSWNDYFYLSIDESEIVNLSDDECWVTLGQLAEVRGIVDIHMAEALGFHRIWAAR